MTEKEKRNERHRLIDSQLRLFKGRGVSIKKLMQVCEVSENTIYTEIKYMINRYKAPIDNSKKMGGYYYTEPFVLPAIDNLPLDEKDLNQLILAAETLNQFEGLTIFQDFRGTIQKISHAIRYKLLKGQTKYSNQTVSDNAPTLIYFESTPSFSGSKYIPTIYKSIDKQLELTFKYQKFEISPTKTVTVCPYWLKEHKNRWYVIGETIHDQSFRIFGLDRIVSEPTTGEFFRRKPTSLDTLMKHSFGLFISDKQPENVVLSMDYTRAQYFKAQPLFDYDYKRNVLVDNEQEFRIQKKLIINQELIMELAKLGASVKVLEPASLKEKLKQYLAVALRQYS